MGKLTDTKLRNLKPTGTTYKLADGGGLYVEVGRTGALTWRYRFRFNSEQTTVTLGEYPALGLDAARRRHLAARQMVRDGKHPEHERERNLDNSFQSVAREWMAEKGKVWSAGYLSQIVRAMEQRVLPVLGARPIRSIEPPEVLAVVRTVGRAHGPVPALETRQWMGAVFRYGVATGKCDRDPCADLRGAMSEHRVRHYRCLEARDVPAFTTALESNTDYQRIVRLYLWLLLLTFVRPAELREARWTEIDWQASLWRIPAEHTKKRRDHLVPLSTQAITKLRELQVLADGSEFLFRSERTPRLAMNPEFARRVLQRMGWLDRITPHGFRSLASTTLNEMGWRPDVIEVQLAHLDGNKTRASYNRAAYLQERTRMMQAWSDFVVSNNVVPLRGAA